MQEVTWRFLVAFFSLPESPLCIMHEFFGFLLCLVGGIELHLVHFVLKWKSPIFNVNYLPRASQVELVVKNLPANAGDIKLYDYTWANPWITHCLEFLKDFGSWVSHCITIAFLISNFSCIPILLLILWSLSSLNSSSAIMLPPINTNIVFVVVVVEG